MPAACCGVIGLFPTHSRVPPQTGSRHFKTTVMSDGPIAGTAADAALVYAVMAARTSGSVSGAHFVLRCFHLLFPRFVVVALLWVEA